MPKTEVSFTPQFDPDILIVDDDPKNHVAFASMLDGLSLRWAFASSGNDALAQLLRHDFAVVLLDVRMPGMDGFETAELIRSREKTRHLPIIFVTAYGSDEIDMRRGYQLGAVDYLFKPIVREALRAKLQVFADLYRRQAEIQWQATRLREVEHQENLRRLEHERRKWEAAALRRQMDEQTRLNERLAEVDRRKNEFIAMLAHELRNPLSPLVTGLELLQTRMTDDDVLSRARDAMWRQVRHLTRLVDDLLDVSRISQGKIHLNREVLDLGIIVQQAVEACRPTLNASRHELVLVAHTGPVPIDADAVRITQVLSNLLNNAARYSDPGSRIVLAWGIDGNHAYARVSDSGRGIAEGMLERIFDSFVQGPDRGPGLGLGLTLVRKLVELHGGSVRAKSEGPGTGSEFVMRLPLAAALPEAESAAAPAAVSIENRPLSVTVVEDDADVRMGLRDLIRSWGHRVTVASSGERAVELLLEKRPDVALLDIGLPGLDGYGVARRVIGELGEGAPRLVALSGFGQDADLIRSKQAGFSAHLVKPPDPVELQRVLLEAPGRPPGVDNAGNETVADGAPPPN